MSRVSVRISDLTLGGNQDAALVPSRRLKKLIEKAVAERLGQAAGGRGRHPVQADSGQDSDHPSSTSWEQRLSQEVARAVADRIGKKIS